MKIYKKIFPAFSIGVINTNLKQMTTKTLFQAVLFIIGLFFFSCTQHKDQERPNTFAPKVVASIGYVVPKDSMAAPKVILVDESKLKKIPVGTPKVVLTNTNIHPAGKPKIVIAGTPRVCTPGQDTFLLAKTVPAIDSPFVAGIPEVVIAKDAYTRDQNPENFSSLSKLQGLKHHNINCMLEDKSGNLWFGTWGGGVSKYDGKSFTHFTDKEGLSNNSVFSMLEDKSGNLWFGTWGGGVSKYDGKSFTHFTDKEGLSNNSVWSMLEDKSGNLWFGTQGGGVSKYDGKSFTHFTDKEGLSNNDVRSMLEDKSGNLWFGTGGGGVSKYDGKSFTHFTDKEGLSNNVVRSMLEDKSGNLWFGTSGGGVSKLALSEVEGSTQYTFTHFTDKEGLSNNAVASILEDKSGNLWFGTDGGGVSKYDGKSFTHFTDKEGLSNNVVRSMLEDKSGNLWFGTDGGVSKYDGKSFTHFTDKEGLSNNVVRSMLEDKSGNLWFGTWGGGVSKYDGKSFTHFTDKEGLSNNSVWSMLEDKSGNLWFGTWGGGVSKYDGKSFTHFTDKEGLSNNAVVSMLEDKSGNLWFGTDGGGVSKYDGKSFTHFTDKEGLSNNVVRSMLEDKSGNLWFGTDGGGVSKYDGKSFTHFTDKEGLNNNSVWSMLEDKSGNLWFGTNGGVSKYDGKSFTHFTDKEGLSNNFVFSMLEDKSGNLWFGTRFGLSKLSPENKEKLVFFSDPDSYRHKSAPEVEGKVFFKNYTYEDGFLGIGVNAGKIICEDKNGTIWVGANDRLTAFHPPAGGESADTTAPNIQLTNIALFNENIAWPSLKQKKDTTITLGNGIQVGNFKFDSLSRWYNLPENLSLAYNNNYLTFNFVGITMAQPKKVKYQYKLEGIDENWSAITNRTEAPYGNLPQGNYTFMVKAMNSEGVWSDEFTYTFSIRPPWWKTWWAYGLYVVLIGGSIRWYVQYRSKALRRKNLILEEKVNHRTNQLQTSLENLKSTQAQLIQSEKMASLGELTAGIAHEIQNPLNFVNNFSEVSNELIDEVLEERRKVQGTRDEELEAELLSDIKQNLQKINHHGHRASSIVKGMLEHSRKSSGTKESTDINALCDEYMRLAYHGLRAKDKDFNVTMETNFDTDLPKIEVVTQDISRVILNIINNAFYAVNERSKLGEESYEPTVTITTLSANTLTSQHANTLTITISDNGLGIPDHIKDKIFQPFFTTKPTGQGTGLGLSLSYDIIKAHGGELKVETGEKLGSTFIIYLHTNN
jgi:ligand-binding sensor domain-containing protein/signal transduction histidine kinase